jgi:6-phosphogluconolactonase
MVRTSRLDAEAAAHLGTAVHAAVVARGRAVVALSGGGTPAGMLARLATLDLPWPRVHVVQVDERTAPDGHPARNLELLREHLGGVLPSANLHAMAVDDPPRDLDRAAGDYARRLREVAGTPPVLDLVHLGLGTDGHTASLIPGDPVVAVTDRDVAVTGPYQGWQRLTLTLPVIDRARHVLWLVSGADKADAVTRLVRADRTVPAGRVRRDRALLLLDEAAGRGLDLPPDADRTAAVPPGPGRDAAAGG